MRSLGRLIPGSAEWLSLTVLDAFLTRATLVPALMKPAVRANWWAPARLRRPHLLAGFSETGSSASSTSVASCVPRSDAVRYILT